MTLPPGQRWIDHFPRFGIALWESPPVVPEPARIRISGAVAQPIEVPVSRLVELERCDMTADFHCVTGFSVHGLQWSGVGFRAFYESVIVPEARPEAGVSHILLEGLDGYRTALELADAFDEAVMFADRLGEHPLSVDHGAPVRLVSPKQYGYKNAKHLCAIELHTREPNDDYRTGFWRRLVHWLVMPHQRARVAEQERHRYLPAWMIRGIYWEIRRIWLRFFNRRR